MVMSPKCTVLSFRGPCFGLGSTVGTKLLKTLLNQLNIGLESFGKSVW
jgi:hypothetical protein